MRALVLWIIGAIVVAVAATSFVVVDETEQVIITQFGRPTAVLSEAGLYYKLPAPVQRARSFDRRTLLTTPPATELLTADKKNVVIETYISWRVTDPLKYLTALRTREFAELRLTALVQSELGSALGDLPFAALVPGDPNGAGTDGGADGASGLTALETAVHEACRAVAAGDFGVEIVSLGITRLNFPPQNLQSVFARMRAERARIARGYRSEGKAEAEKIRAEANRERSDIVATAESKAARLRGEGEAAAARIYGDAYADHERFFLFLRTLQTYERVLNDNTTLVLPADSPFLELLTSRGPTPSPPFKMPGERD
ncbi:MAG: protease modulator HflC [Candidatus Binatia bacterium]